MGTSGFDMNKPPNDTRSALPIAIDQHVHYKEIDNVGIKPGQIQYLQKVILVAMS